MNLLKKALDYMEREIAVEILQEVGFSLETAEDGTIAVEKMRHADAGNYDLILMDAKNGWI